jgi:hypothetical protein
MAYVGHPYRMDYYHMDYYRMEYCRVDYPDFRD